MPICKHCFKEFTEEDLKEAGRDLAKEGIDIDELELCPECTEGISDFEGDYNPLHPNETEDEFDDHED